MNFFRVLRYERCMSGAMGGEMISTESYELTESTDVSFYPPPKQTSTKSLESTSYRHEIKNISWIDIFNIVSVHLSAEPSDPCHLPPPPRLLGCRLTSGQSSAQSLRTTGSVTRRRLTLEMEGWSKGCRTTAHQSRSLRSISDQNYRPFRRW